MSRAERLIDLLHALRQHRRPVSGRRLAEDLGVSLRTIYRDIESLKAQGADIDGEAGLGFVLRPGFLLPPMMFDETEVDVLLLGLRWVMSRHDPDLTRAARSALARIEAVLPAARRDALPHAGLLAGPAKITGANPSDLAAIRTAMRAETKLRLDYTDAGGATTSRLVWPVALAFFEQVRVVVAWCELREGFRHFRTDRIRSLAGTSDRYPRPRRVLLRQWREQEGAIDPS